MDTTPTQLHTQESLEHKRHEDEYTATFWREKVKRTDTSYPTTYTVYLHGNVPGIGTIEHVKTLESADGQLAAIIEDPTSEWTYGIIYEVKPVVRRGTSYKRKKDSK